MHASEGSISSAQVVSTPAGAPTGISTPFGWLTFTVSGLTPGATVTLTFTVPSGFTLTGYEKCNNGSCSTLSGATVSGSTLTVTLTDGGTGDTDGAADGTITDPGAIIATSNTSNTSLNGTYGWASLINLQTGSTAAVGTATADGAGNWTSSQDEDDDGTIASTTSSGTDTITANGALTLTPSGDAPYMGNLSADGNTFVVENLNAGGNPELIVATKRGPATYSNASLNGTYAVGSLGGFEVSDGNEASYDDYGVLISVTFDGAGNYTVTSEIENDGGSVVTDETGSGTYSVASDGTVTITVGSGTLTAELSADGNTLVGAVLTSSATPEIDIGIKQGQGTFTTASLSGTYSVAALTDNSGGSNGLLGTLTFDGAGNVTGTSTQNDAKAGTVATVSLAGTYSVAADGTVTVNFSAGPTTLTGNFSADGNALVLEDLQSGDNPGIMILIR